MNFFRRKSVIVEARLLTENWDEIRAWINANGGDAYLPAGPDCDIRILTLEGWIHAIPGDWIIKGVKGEFYICKPNIFELTYEEVTT